MSELSDNEEAPRARQSNYWLLVENEISSMPMLAFDLDGEDNPLGRPKGTFKTGQASHDVKEGR